MDETHQTIFYSWQDDRPKKDNHYFIRDALSDAVEKVRNENVNIEPRVDFDTQGEPGTPSISNLIFKKIDKAVLFVADVSIIGIGDGRSEKTYPNPNVLIELGYAVKRLGWERIVLVMNKYYGGLTSLPFHLKSRRGPIMYHLPPTVMSNKYKENERMGLSYKLRDAINECVRNGLFELDEPVNSKRFAVLLSNAILPLQNTIRNLATPKSHKQFDEYDGWKSVPLDLSDPVRQKTHSELLKPIVDVLAKKNIYQEVVVDGISYADKLIENLKFAIGEINVAISRYPQQDERLTGFGYALINNLESLLNSIEFHKKYGIPDNAQVGADLAGFREILRCFISAKVLLGKFIGYV